MEQSTCMTDLQIELAHLAKNSSPHPNCAEYCQAKANWLAQKYPERFKDLPHLLASALQSKVTPTPSTRVAG